MRKKLITMGLVSALGASTSAMAADLDATAPGNAPTAFALDSATTAQTNTDGTVDLPTSQGIVDSTAIGVGVAGGESVNIRFDLTGAEFEGAVVGGEFSIGGFGSMTAVVQGGADGGTFVIYEVSSNATTPIQQTTNFNFAGNVAVTAGTSATVTVSVYETPTNAINEQDALYSIGGAFAAFSDSLGIDEVNADSEEAEVSTGFTRFNATLKTAGLTGEIGDFNYAPTTTLTDMNTGAAVAAGNAGVAASAAIATTNVLLEGDVSFGDWYLGTQDTCAATVLDLAEAEDGESASNVAAAALSANTAYSVCVDVDGTDDVINEGSYTITLEWATGTRPFPVDDSTATVGAITRNGTTKYIPYLTTFEDYNQRLVIVNRGTTDAAYSLTFTSEDGVTATAGSAATGTVPAGEVLSIKASDIVTLTGKTRTAATLLVVAASANIDVATNQVNLSDGSTDTVVY